MVKKDAKIYIAGHRGMVGSAVWRALKKTGYTNLLGKTSSDLDLRNQQAVLEFYATEIHFTLEDCCKSIIDYYN